MRRTIGTLPFLPTTAATLKQRLRELIDDEPYRATRGAMGEAYVSTFHDYATNIDRLELMYELARAKRRTAGR
jgi:hypothetical protein